MAQCHATLMRNSASAMRRQRARPPGYARRFTCRHPQSRRAAVSSPFRPAFRAHAATRRYFRCPRFTPRLLRRLPFQPRSPAAAHTSAPQVSRVYDSSVMHETALFMTPLQAFPPARRS